jgi:hypothetical protein
VTYLHKECAVNCIGHYTTTKENNSYGMLVSLCRNCDEHVSLLIADKVIIRMICTYSRGNSPRLPQTSPGILLGSTIFCDSRLLV